ncbi:DMT family transporter [Brevundimonas diminuta]|uniref:EamA family transporter n=1 Tax=Brevundimonas diminuta TaxID=293 RepID=UPI002097AD86|nr:DMT family transporter [Brevundimonas diminuta]MCO8017789.1 DMT family transporter [Brevundimonas diminuta]MCO8021309.1 DMT family transporter [Brevundimonas diminuta]
MSSPVLALRHPRLSAVLPYLALIGGMVSLSAGTSFAKTLYPMVGPAGTAGLRVGLSAIVLLAVFRPWRSAFTTNDLRALAIYGVVMGLMNLSFYMALNTIPLGVALAIEFMGPLSVALFNSRRLIHFVWVGLAVLGLVLLLPLDGKVSGLDPVGCAYAAAAAVFWAGYIVFGKRVSHLPSGSTVAIGMTFAAMTVVPFGVAGAGMSLLDPRILALGLVVALVSSALPYTLDMVALRHIPKRTFGVAVSGDPAIGALAGLFVLGEHLTSQQWLAIAAIIAASVGAVLTSPSDEQPLQDPAAPA